MSLLLLLICITLAANCLSGFSSPAQQPSTAFQGTWTASVSAGGQVFRGTWSAATSPQTRNSLQGSWTLLNESSELVLQGTWIARKSARVWRGTWSARAANGGSYSGTWDADLPDFTGKTLEDMLKGTIEKQVAGSWRSGRYQGYWWLDGSTSKPAPR